MPHANDYLYVNARRVRLPDGTPAIIRPMRREARAELVEAVRNLSPESRYQRFLSYKSDLTPAELDYLTHFDGVNHIVLVLLITDEAGEELFPVAIAHCVRDRHDTALAEIAITVADEWQKRGVGRTLMQIMAERCWEVGIRRWKALFLVSNKAARHLMDAVGTLASETFPISGEVEVIYQLAPPR
jgi:acetyltransferase